MLTDPGRSPSRGDVVDDASFDSDAAVFTYRFFGGAGARSRGDGVVGTDVGDGGRAVVTFRAVSARRRVATGIARRRVDV